MKKLLLAAVAVVVFTGCENNKEKVAQLNTSKDSLQQIVLMKDSIINEAFLDINEIATTLSSITEREKLVAGQTQGEITKTKKEQITENINAIAALLEKNRQTIARLSGATQKLKEANVQIEGLKKLVASLELQLAEKNVQIEELAQKVQSLNIEVANLNSAISGLKEDKASLESTLAEQTIELNTVYFVIGSEKDLMNNKIIDKKGFIGRTKTANANADLGNFTKADLRNVERIPINQKKVTLVTAHPSDSYMFVEGAKNVTEELIITDKNRFWSNSKFLVISYK
ncbi:putative lipoprotein [Mucinivorans hirudinis]|uniref:Putative lipoprotein n=1 Tax=Mucinivorans hirudinis TaxID=1433126 RepID=A0A060R7C9_9BACT|nr:putative lipoprotein [Mucinivorans hirudinis]